MLTLKIAIFTLFLETSVLHTEKTHQWALHSLKFTTFNALKSLPYVWKCHINSCCLSNPFEIQWKPAHPQPSPTSLSSERCQCQSYHTGSFGVEKGVFLIFCLVQFPYCELGWQLECYYTQHASVKPGYSSPLGTLCFTGLWQTKKPYTHQFLLWIHT